MSFPPNDLPASPAEWERAQQSFEAESIHTLGPLDSASNIQKPHFLLLRALWVRKIQSKFAIKDWLEKTYIEDAVLFLDDYSDWKSYLESFSQDIKLEQRPFPSLGAFTLVKYSQLEADTTEKKNSNASVLVSPPKTRSMTAAEKAQNATPSKPPTNLRKFLNIEHDDDEDSFQDDPDTSYLSPWTPAKKGEQKILYPPTQDEQIVNAALLNFLAVVTIAHPHTRLRWCLAHKVLKFVCKAAQYEARTDGYLRGQNHSTAYAIVEAKPYIRENAVHTLWQETAQMAAWISEDPPTGGSKFQ
jgi:hypothetical protein